MRNLILISLLILATAAHAASPDLAKTGALASADVTVTTGTASIEYYQYSRGDYSTAPAPAIRWRIIGEADNAGNVEIQTEAIQGALLVLRTNPYSGDDAPSALWDVRIFNDDDANADPADLLDANGMNRSESATWTTGNFTESIEGGGEFTPNLLGPLRIVISGMGDGNTVSLELEMLE